MDEIEEIDPGLAYLRILLELYDRDVDPNGKTEYIMDDYQHIHQTKQQGISPSMAVFVSCPNRNGEISDGFICSIESTQ